MASGAVGERCESIGSRFAATSRTAGAGAAGPSDRHETGARSATGEDTRREIGQHSFPRLRMWNSRRRVRQARQAAESLRRKVPQSSTAGGVAAEAEALAVAWREQAVCREAVHDSGCGRGGRARRITGRDKATERPRLFATLGLGLWGDNVVALVMIIVKWAIPDMSCELRDRIRREAFVINTVLMDETRARSQAGGTLDRDSRHQGETETIAEGHWNNLLSASLSGSDFDLAAHGDHQDIPAGISKHVVSEQPPEPGPGPTHV
ncbi:unnamed protein product [Plutella xylostella]|uniref:(diamondback moth) hypothetical protein n=1 Tax=Plutella xylostella TaxID=51655 RepID=A0A8S4DYK3_PLUXY|nr:unnamed protein product [Plutella xylostella]